MHVMGLRGLTLGSVAGERDEERGMAGEGWTEFIMYLLWGFYGILRSIHECLHLDNYVIEQHAYEIRGSTFEEARSAHKG
ncbi:unnamed protein product [Toxocara canis]|uniref:Retrotransposon protein n=1 Tax=Toxocara canis TaxID=6265 RepID=A0A183UKV0_TOXCA|nr:unnamed protein product [Toxocara canis]